jgi:hypothetical protein
MIRIAALLALIALAAMAPLLVRLEGTTAIIFSFVGMPALGLALALYVVARWRAGAFHFNHER